MSRAVSRRERQRLNESIHYLNLQEIKSFCMAHELAHHIFIETERGLRKTNDRDRKDVVLQRILDFALRGKKTGPTVYAHPVVSDQPLPELLSSRTRIHYGQYEKKNSRFVEKLKELTGGEFRTGMIARLVLRDFWTEGKAPTMRQFADEWLRASAAHTEPRPEGAYLADLSKGRVDKDWKDRRVERAKEALNILDRLVQARQDSS